MNPEALDEDAREFYEERASIREYVGGQSRADAEAGAAAETERYVERRAAPRSMSQTG